MLEDEVYASYACGFDSGTVCPHSSAWQRLHLGGNFSSAWTCQLSNGEFDVALRQNKLAGRWLNYYVEGLRQSLTRRPTHKASITTRPSSLGTATSPLFWTTSHAFSSCAPPFTRRGMCSP